MVFRGTSKQSSWDPEAKRQGGKKFTIKFLSRLLLPLPLISGVRRAKPVDLCNGVYGSGVFGVPDLVICVLSSVSETVQGQAQPAVHS